MAFGPDGNLYVSSSFNHRVLRYNGTTGAFIDTFAIGGGLSNAQGLAFGPDGNLYVGNFNGDSFLRYNGTTGAFIDTFVAPGSGGLNAPVDVRFGRDGNRYVQSSQSARVVRYDGTTGAVLDIFVGGGLASQGYLLFTKDVTFAPIPPAQMFACGAGAFTEMKIGISDRGSVAQLNSPGLTSNEHIVRSGYQVCYRNTAGGAFSTSYDFGLLEAGWSGGVTTSQPSGPGTFPLEITRTTADGRVRITRRFTANSFAASCPGGNCPSGYDSDGDGIACNILGDCGNCTNRTLHVLTRVTNLTGGSLFDVTVTDKADFDIAGQTTNQFGRSEDSVVAFTDSSVDAANAYGMVLQTLIIPASSAVVSAGGYGFPNDCNATTLTTPTALGNFEGLLRQNFGTLSPGANTGNSIRTDYRRF